MANNDQTADDLDCFMSAVIEEQRLFKEFRWLFYSSKDRFDFLFEAASEYFTEQFHSRLARAALGVCRLTDAPGKDLRASKTESGERGNDRRRVSYKAIHRLYRDCDNYPTDAYTKINGAAKKADKQVRTWRNVAIAHLGRSYATDEMQLDEVQPGIIQEFLDACEHYILSIRMTIGRGPIDMSVPLGGVVQLVKRLGYGMALLNARSKETITPSALLRQVRERGF